MDKIPFVAKHGQIDFTLARYAPVINSLVKHGDKILIVRRNKDSIYYPDLWAGINGFLDDAKTVEEKIEEEMFEELAIKPDQIIKTTAGPVFEYESPQYNKVWIAHPMLVEINTDKITLDWEATEYKWIYPQEVKNYQFGPGFMKVFEIFFPKSKN